MPLSEGLLWARGFRRRREQPGPGERGSTRARNPQSGVAKPQHETQLQDAKRRYEEYKLLRMWVCLVMFQVPRRLYLERPLLGLLRRHHQRRVHADGHRSPGDGPAVEGLHQPPRPAGGAGAGHGGLRHLSVGLPGLATRFLMCKNDAQFINPSRGARRTRVEALRRAGLSL